MKELEYAKKVFEINENLIEKYTSLMYTSVKTLDHTNTKEIKRVLDLKTTIDDIAESQEKLTERIQILEEEEKNDN